MVTAIFITVIDLKNKGSAFNLFHLPSTAQEYTYFSQNLVEFRFEEDSPRVWQQWCRGRTRIGRPTSGACSLRLGRVQCRMRSGSR